MDKSGMARTALCMLKCVLLREGTTYTCCAVLLLLSLMQEREQEWHGPSQSSAVQRVIYTFPPQTCPPYSFSVLVNWFFGLTLFCQKEKLFP